MAKLKTAPARKKTVSRRKASATAPKSPAKPAPRRSAAGKGVPPEVGADAVRRATGRGWDEWFAVLDAENAREMAHKDIALLLHEKHGVGEWLCQTVTVGYERARGLRAKHQRPDGFQVSASRTMNVSARAAFEAWNDAAKRSVWLTEPITIRKTTPNKTLRITWHDGTNLEVNLWPKGPNKTQVVAQHSKLPSAAAGERMKAFWAGKLRELEGVVG